MRMPMPRGERGVALLIVLLVTSLLIALIFEFSYATRISLNSAINFRDSQRAYFLARSGIYAFIKYGDQLRDNYIPQGEWGIVPMISDGDTQVLIRWEDERGKININTISSSDTSEWIGRLFAIKGISTEVVDKIKALKQGPPAKTFKQLSELHAVMVDDDFDKVAGYLTTSSDSIININTASEDVLKSVLPNNLTEIGMILNARKTKKIAALSDVAGLDQSRVAAAVLNNLQTSSTFFRVKTNATVGGYTKQIEAVVNGGTISYWRAL